MKVLTTATKLECNGSLKNRVSIHFCTTQPSVHSRQNHMVTCFAHVNPYKRNFVEVFRMFCIFLYGVVVMKREIITRSPSRMKRTLFSSPSDNPREKLLLNLRVNKSAVASWVPHTWRRCLYKNRRKRWKRAITNPQQNSSSRFK